MPPLSCREESQSCRTAKTPLLQRRVSQLSEACNSSSRAPLWVDATPRLALKWDISIDINLWLYRCVHNNRHSYFLRLHPHHKASKGRILVSPSHTSFVSTTIVLRSYNHLTANWRRQKQNTETDESKLTALTIIWYKRACPYIFGVESVEMFVVDALFSSFSAFPSSFVAQESKAKTPLRHPFQKPNRRNNCQKTMGRVQPR